MINGDPLLGIGGAPTRVTTLPVEAKERKKYPVASGCLDYFPDALCAVARLSQVGNDQHNAGKPLHWDRSKSGDEADTMMRHFMQRGTVDTDGIRHSVKMAWRALALLQKELESVQAEENVVKGGQPLTFSKYEYWVNNTGKVYRYPVNLSVGTSGEFWTNDQWYEESDPPLRECSPLASKITEQEALRHGARID